MGLKEADESKLLSRLEKLGRDVSALRWNFFLSSYNKQLPHSCCCCCFFFLSSHNKQLPLSCCCCCCCLFFLSSHNKQLPPRAEQAKLNSGLDVCLGKADNLGIAPNAFFYFANPPHPQNHWSRKTRKWFNLQHQFRKVLKNDKRNSWWYIPVI